MFRFLYGICMYEIQQTHYRGLIAVVFHIENIKIQCTFDIFTHT